MTSGRIKLEEKVKALYAAYVLKTSGHMKDRGYELICSYPDMEMDHNGNKSIKGLTLCYNHPEEDSYLHLDVNASPEGDVSEVGYLMTMGDWETVQKDIVAIGKEIVEFSNSRKKPN